MKKIEAIIRKSKFDDVKEALYNVEVNFFSYWDVTGVGKLVSMAVKLGSDVNEKIKIGICGEHGGDPASIYFCKENGLDYVSCSPFRVPIARLSAAQAEL